MKKQNWTEKYRPKYFLDVKNQELAVQTVKRFLMGFSMGKKGKRSVILHGPPGTGKTSLAHVAAAETSSEIFELNASDLRNKGKLIEVLRPATKQKSLIKKGKIILIDEVDGVAGNADRGGVLELLRIIETSNYPIIITANDIWDKKFSPLRRKSEIVQLKEIDYQTTKNILIDILRKENKFIPMDVLTNISIKAKGDLRAAINDLQTASQLENPADVVFDERNKEVDIFSAMRMIFKGSPSRNMLRIFDSVNMSMDEIILWMEENIPAEYQGEELAEAYERLSRVDIFKRRIYKQQYWRFLVYENALLSYGISSAKKSEKTGFTNYKKPTRILKMWLNNRRIEKKKSIAKKYAAHVHVGEKRALKEFPTIKAFLMKPGIQKELKLTREEIDYLEQKV